MNQAFSSAAKGGLAGGFIALIFAALAMGAAPLAMGAFAASRAVPAGP